MTIVMAPEAPGQLWTAIKIIHYACPAFVFAYFLISLAITVCTLQTQRLRVQDEHVRRNIMIGLLFGVTFTYLAEVVVTAIRGAITNHFADQDHVVYLIASALAIGTQALAITDSKFPVWYPYYVTWFIEVIVELSLLVVSNVFRPPQHALDFVLVAIQLIRLCLFITLPSLYFRLRNDDKEYDNADAEQQSLLRKKLAPKPSSSEETLLNGNGNGNGYGATETTNSQSDTADNASDAGSEDSYFENQRKAKDLINKRLEQDGNWFTYAKGFTIFFPYLWPFHDKKLQFRAVLVGLCLLSSNAFNVLVPNQFGIMIDSLTKYAGGNHEHNVWLPVAVYALLRFLAGGACLGWIRKWLWMPLEQYSYDALSTASHKHLMSLSSDFHDNKTTSDLSQAIHGGRSVADLLETVCFEVVPMFIDLAVAFAYLWSHFGPYMGLTMAATCTSYLYITTKLYARRANKRRDFIAIYRKEWTIGQQSLDGWNTASLFNMIPHERRRYASAVKDHMKAKGVYEMSSQVITASQGLVMAIGLLGALWLGVYQVIYEGTTVGRFSTLLVYWAQLQGPLIFFSSMYRQISYSLMDAERLLELLQTKPTITDLPNAKPLKLGKGEVKFDRVSFAYDQRKPTLKNVSFLVPEGKTVALVGETGGGKSTILKLMDRFYDVNSGSISIDGQDIRDVTLDSLRDKIGVVPQDPMLFNDSIMNNIRYARLSASDQEVYEACQAAAIHDKIMSFPDGYNSRVGDRGVKLSGGEKQRVAIARAMLKCPKIILLDEATSAVDTDTEQKIQEGFKELCKGRTTFIVAHRLSTIMKADHILVVMNGEIIEEGSHDELIHKKGKYQNLWSKQIFVKPAADARSRSQSPRKRDANIINDLTPNRGMIELAKALQTTEHQHSDSIENGTPITSEGTQANTVSEASHVREGSKLKPDAPEFVPTLFTTTPRDSLTFALPSVSPTKAALKEKARIQKQKEKGEHKTASLAKKSGKKMAKLAQNVSESKPSAGEDSSSAALPRGQITDTENSTLDKAKTKRVRFPSRRNLAKSEPPRASFDGQHDEDLTAINSSEIEPLLQNPSELLRRVSAPSDPPTAESHSARPRRNRHWRLKNRAADATKIREVSGSSVDENYVSLVPPPTGESSHA